MPRIPAALLAIVGVLLFPTLVRAQQVPAVAVAAPLAAAPTLLAPLVPPSHLQLQRNGFIGLSASLASLQVYDTYSTLSAIKLGGTESNPLMSGIVKHPAALILLKAGVAGSSIFAASELWRQHRRGAALILLAVTNGTMAIVAAHNAATLSTMRAGSN